SGGEPLSQGVRADMETRLGQDFSDVRVHTDAAADESARSGHAQAYTVGSHVVFQRSSCSLGLMAPCSILLILVKCQPWAATSARPVTSASARISRSTFRAPGEPAGPGVSRSRHQERHSADSCPRRRIAAIFASASSNNVPNASGST
ncbi:MAG: DUF4157 domain-containing protein, partial [Pseudonocardia sp.]|nr:DUF4157 domain-containing protein [Pseudonocardia sp.]